MHAFHTWAFLCLVPLVSSVSPWVLPCSDHGAQICSPSYFSPTQLSWLSPSHLSALFNLPWNGLFSKSTTHPDCSLGTHRPAWGGKASSSSEVWRQLLPQAQKVFRASLVGCSHCSPAAFVHPLISPSSGRGASYSRFLLHCLLKYTTPDFPVCFPWAFPSISSGLELFSLSSPFLKLSCRVGHLVLCGA